MPKEKQFLTKMEMRPSVLHQFKKMSMQSALFQCSLPVYNFLSDLLTNILHHKIVLKLYHKSMSEFKQLFDSVYVDIYFSKNLTFGIKLEP